MIFSQMNFHQVELRDSFQKSDYQELLRLSNACSEGSEAITLNKGENV
jgi:hypothetical protein